jgi:heat shock protein HtpX
MANNLKTALLLTGMTLFVIFVGQMLGGQRGAVLALVLAGLMNFISYFFSDKIAIMSSGAKPISREELPRLYEILERLTSKANLPMPKLYIIPTDSPNAFATGRNPNHASVAVTAGILKILTDDELEGELAHELGHVRNRDSGGIISALAMMILAPLAAMMIQMAVSRSREFQADATGAHFTGNPYALANALRKIEEWSRRIPMAASPATAHLYISMPRLGMTFGNLFSTHPPTAERIARLTGMSTQQTF